MILPTKSNNLVEENSVFLNKALLIRYFSDVLQRVWPTSSHIFSFYFAAIIFSHPSHISGEVFRYLSVTIYIIINHTLKSLYFRSTVTGEISLVVAVVGIPVGIVGMNLLWLGAEVYSEVLMPLNKR